MRKFLLAIPLVFVVSACAIQDPNKYATRAAGTYVTTSSLRDCYLQQFKSEWEILNYGSNAKFERQKDYEDIRRHLWDIAQSVIDRYNGGEPVYQINNSFYNQGIEKTSEITYCNAMLF